MSIPQNYLTIEMAELSKTSAESNVVIFSNILFSELFMLFTAASVVIFSIS
jgi:hypothetical protein